MTGLAGITFSVHMSTCSSPDLRLVARRIPGVPPRAVGKTSLVGVAWVEPDTTSTVLALPPFPHQM